ncbi:hypothetical protein [Saprospira grandis]|uniref:hypothetical protein n=1 Tax=Saprospira grandis TaxID=1008 RepID=UPI00031930ED|nr:hypothetical protein [Saprospira grandis]
MSFSTAPQATKRHFILNGGLKTSIKKQGLKFLLGKINGPKIIMFKAAEDFNPLRTIDVE